MVGCPASLNSAPMLPFLAYKPEFSPPPALGDSHRVLPFRNVKYNVDVAIFSHGPPSVREDRLRCPSNPRLLHERAGHRLSDRDHDV